MKVYLDGSAIIWHYARHRINELSGVSRTHALAEVFSALKRSGISFLLSDGTIRHRKLSMGLAQAVIAQIHTKLQYVDLSSHDVLTAISSAKAKNAQGGRIHDLLHAVAAEKAEADELWTTDRNDFEGLGNVPLSS